VVLPRLPGLIQQLREDASDAELLDRYVQHRADDAFSLLVSRYGRLVWAQCRNLLANEADADDAFQATFLVLAKSAQSIRTGSPLGPWLHGVAFRVCQNARRAAVRRARREGECSRPEASQPVPDSAWAVAFAAVAEEVQKLPDAQRQVFVLCGLEGRTEGEAADALGQKVGTVSSRLARAKQTLLDRLTRRGFGAGGAVLGGITASMGNAPAAVAARALSRLVPGAAVPNSIRSLTRGVVTMMSARFKLLTVGALLTVALTFGVASGWLGNARAQKPPEPGPLPTRGVPPKVEVAQFKVDHPVECFAMSRDGKTIALGGPEKTVVAQGIYQPGRCTLMDAASGKVVRVIKTDRPARSLGFSPNGKHVLIGELNRSKLVQADKLGSVPTRVWEVESGKPVLELDGHMDMVRGAAYFPDGKRMITSSADGSARVWSATTGKELLLVRTGAFNDGVELSPDGQRVLVGSGLTKLTVWNAESGQGEFTIDTTYSANNAVYSPDGAMIAVCSTGVNDITLWDGKTGEKKGSIVVSFDPEKKVAIAGNVTSNLAFSPDGKWLATGNGHLSDDDAAGEVTVWDVETRKKAAEFHGHAARVNCVAFTPDGQSIISCSADGTVVVRDFPPLRK
jgi:RNA polymerase sigma factor (sigma-70 family)